MYLEHQILGRRFLCPIVQATQRNILQIDGFLVLTKSESFNKKQYMQLNVCNQSLSKHQPDQITPIGFKRTFTLIRPNSYSLVFNHQELLKFYDCQKVLPRKHCQKMLTRPQIGVIKRMFCLFLNYESLIKKTRTIPIP